MKHRPLMPKDRACPPRTRLGVLRHLPTTPPALVQQRTPHPNYHGLTLHPCFLAPTNPRRRLTHSTRHFRYAIQIP